jgi:hypothetical protein
MNEEEIQNIYFSQSRIPPGTHLALNERNALFFSHAKRLGVILNKRITWRLHIEITEATAFRTFIRAISLFKIERLSPNIKLVLLTVPIRSVMTYVSSE